MPSSLISLKNCIIVSLIIRKRNPHVSLLTIFSVDGQFCICVAAELLDRRRRIVMYAKSLSLSLSLSTIHSFLVQQSQSWEPTFPYLHLSPDRSLLAHKCPDPLSLSLPLPRRPLPVPQFSLDSRSSCSMCVLCAAVSAWTQVTHPWVFQGIVSISLFYFLALVCAFPETRVKQIICNCDLIHYKLVFNATTLILLENNLNPSPRSTNDQTR